MSFKDLLDKYNNENASEEEIKLIEEELDKHEAIEDYLSEKYNIGFEKDNLHLSTYNETTFVKRSVNKRLRNVILASVSIVFLILFIIYFIVSPIVSSLYYNPSQKTVGKGNEDLYFDLRVFTELTLPGYAINTAGSEKLGFGGYNIYFERSNLFNRERSNINAKIKRNIITGNFESFFAGRYFSFFDTTQPDPNRDELIEMQNKIAIDHIKALNSVSYIACGIVFKEDLSVEEFNKSTVKYFTKINFKWLGIRTESQGKPTNDLSGFNPNFDDGYDSRYSADKNKYPYLQLGDVMRDRGDKRISFSEAYTEHFTSLLKYMNDREKAVRALGYKSVDVDYYKNALNYVEKNGVNIYGVLIYGEARDVLEFISNQEINTIRVNSVLPSKYIN